MTNSPLKPPVSGDIVQAENGKIREVTQAPIAGHLLSGNVWYKTNNKQRICWISTWQKWCRKNKAVILRRGAKND